MEKLEKPYTKKEYFDFKNLNTGKNIFKFDETIYALSETEIFRDGEVVDISEEPEYLAKKLEESKELLLKQHEQIRDKRIAAGVTYKNSRFEIDADNKINLLTTLMNMEDTVQWSSADNDIVELTKAEITELGGLISQLTSEIWSPEGLNIHFKNMINQTEIPSSLPTEEIMEAAYAGI
jgi:hypothetical protein